MPDEAFGVHGIGPDLLENPRPPEKGEVTLKDKPVFAKVGQGFLDFIQDSKLVIHNASFDMKFLNAELRWMGLPQPPMDQALDTLAIARKRFPGSPASLDALCRRFNIDNTNRVLHGALLDSEILAEVYLELIGGRQPDFGLSTSARVWQRGAADDWRPTARPTPLPSKITDEERAAHEAFVSRSWAKTPCGPAPEPKPGAGQTDQASVFCRFGLTAHQLIAVKRNKVDVVQVHRRDSHRRG